MMEYPKIDTLFTRDRETFKIEVNTFRRPEFGIVSRWIVTEKIDGMSIRIVLHGDGSVDYVGRTNRAQLPGTLMTYFYDTLPPERIRSSLVSGSTVVLFGEGYGAGIQKGGIYRPDPAFRLFDVVVITDDRDWWFDWSDVETKAKQLGIETVPVIGYDFQMKEAIALVPGWSIVASKEGSSLSRAEGIVARTKPMLFNRHGERIMWKLKVTDINGVEK